MSKQSGYLRKLALDSPDRKPSVFERLGTKSSVVSGKNVCQSWAQTGTCPLNKTCKYAHTHVLISPSKRSKAETMKKQPVVLQKKNIKDDHKKIGRSHQSSEPDWEHWELGDLEGADETALERRRRELQRELQIQMKKEKELIKKKDKKTDKKRARSSSTSSSSSSESSSSTSSSSSSSSEPRKRQKRKRKRASSSSDSEVSPHRRRKSPKPIKGKVNTPKKIVEKKDSKTVIESRNKSVIVAKKTVGQKKSSSPSWERSRVRSPLSKPPFSKKSSPHQSPGDCKNRSSSPRYDRGSAKSKNRAPSPKAKVKEPSPKRTVKKIKESSVHAKDRPSRPSPAKNRSPPRVHKTSPPRSRRHEDASDKRRPHYDEKKHSPRRDRSREKDRKREIRRGHSHEDDNGGLKKGGKILPLKPASYTKDNTVKPKDSGRHKSTEKNLEGKSKDDENDRDRSRIDREKDKVKCDRDRSKHKKGDEHDRRPGRDRDSDRGPVRGRDDRCRDREAERIRIAKEREAERQKERDEALERCRERQRERERLEKERKEKEEKKHHRDLPDNKQKDYERELPSLLDLKTENPSRGHGDSVGGSKNSDKHSQRDNRRNIDKMGDKGGNQDRDVRDRDRVASRPQGTPPDKDHDRRDSRRPEDDRRQLEKDYDARRNRENDVRRPIMDTRRPVDDRNDSRRPWDDNRRPMEPSHDRRRPMEPGMDDRRPHSMLRRPVDDQYDYRRGREDNDLDVRDFPPDDRRGRKLMHGYHHEGQDWDTKDQELEYREAELRDEWNHPDRHHDWNSRYDHKWMDHEEPRDGGWNHYPRRPPPEDWNNDWQQEDQSHPMYSGANEEHMDMINEDYNDHNLRRHPEPDTVHHVESIKEAEAPQEPATQWEDNNPQAEGDALSDISDDPDDILNQGDELVDEAPATTPAAPPPPNPTAIVAQNTNARIFVRSDEFFFDQKRPLMECLGERALDFEEISDEELEEEARVSRGGIADVLGADWAGLVQETRPRPKRVEGPGSAHRRWMMDRIVSRLGISVKYAGQEFTDTLLNKYKNEAKENVILEFSKPTISNTEDSKIEKVEIQKPDNEKEEKECKKIESTSVKLDLTEDVKHEVGITLLHSVPGLHCCLKEYQTIRSSLFQSHHRFKRALSARSDLSLRRELCNLTAREPLHFTPPLDSKMYEISVQLFQKNIQASTAAA